MRAVKNAVIATILVLGSSVGSIAADSGLFSAAVKLYQAKSYSQAAADFAKVLQEQPGNTVAALYLANCHYEQRQLTSAITYYRWIVDTHPHSTEATTARTMLSRMLGQSSMSSNRSSSGHDAASSSSGRSNGESKPITDAEIDQMVSVVRPRGDDPACTPEFIESVKNELHKFPKPLMRFMKDHGCQVCITPLLIDRNPELKNSRPRTYEQGKTYKNCPAMFESPNVVICQYSMDDSDNVHINNDSLGSLKHEFGHAVDHFMGGLSHQPGYRHVYFSERSRVNDAYRGDLSYYIQTGNEYGAAECFAEGFAVLQGGRDETTGPWGRNHNNAFRESFPGVLKFIDTRIADLNK